MNQKLMFIRNAMGTALICVLAGACTDIPPKPTKGHVSTSVVSDAGIPATVRNSPILSPPEPGFPVETYSLVATDVPVRDLLFTLARDASMNVDIRPDVTGNVTINAIDQTLPQILDRISRQVDLRFDMQDRDLVVAPDSPYLHSYKIDYVNMSRDNTSSVSVTTQIETTGQGGASEGGGGGDGGGSNNSSTTVASSSVHNFWDSLSSNIRSILGESADSDSETDSTPLVIVNRESGIISVLASSRQHRQVQQFVDNVMANVRRQVLIEATVVEVALNDDYQFGVDWARLADNGTGLSLRQDLIGDNLSDPPVFILDYFRDTKIGEITATVKMLQEFGDVRVLSSPKIMALNNQTAILKVVENLVYFTTEAETTQGETLATTSFTTTLHTVPVGFVMAVTPQISSEETVTLNVRPTISRVTSFVEDPNPALAQAGTTSLVPQILVEELDSMLRVNDGQVAVLGGLIQDKIDFDSQGLPYLMQLDYIGDAFTYKNQQIRKTELVIFLRPRVITNASIDGELSDFQRYLPSNLNTTSQDLRKDGGGS